MAELLTAVRSEILAERRGDGGDAHKVPLSGGRRVSSAGGRFEYLFACKKWNEALDGVPVLMRESQARGLWASAEASRMPDGTVRLITTEDYGPSVRNAQVRKDDAAGLVTLAARLESAGETGGSIHVGSADWIVGRGTPQIARDPNPGRWISSWKDLRLNSRQRLAIEQALASQILFLWGPPGTGKTDVVGHVVEGNFRQGLNVLFLAPTKVAVDQALERICDLLAGQEGFADGLVQRAGEIEVASLRERYGAYVDTEQITTRVSAQLDEALSQTSQSLKNMRALVALHDDMASLEERLVASRGGHTSAKQNGGAHDQEIFRAEVQAAELRLKISQLGTPSGLFAKRKESQLAALHTELNRTDVALQLARQQRADARRSERQAAHEIEDLSGRLAAARQRLAGVPARPILARQAEAEQKRLEELDQQRRKIQDTVRSRCRIMGATVAKAVQSRKLLDRVDVVVIDEAGMVDLPSAWLAAGLAGKRVVVAGDFRQLPAVTKGDGDRKATEEERAHSRHWASRDAFHAAGLVSASGAVRQDPRLVSLDTQYRMRESICAVVNAVAYPDAPLRTGRDDRSRIPANPLVDATVLLIDTSKQRILGPDKKANTVNEAVVHELIRGLQFEQVLPGRKWQAAEVPRGERASDRLAVIAPYRAQVKALQGSLKYRFGEEYEGLVDTIHRFQGSQRPIVVFDTAVGAGKDPGFFYQGAGLSSSTCRLLNVALSRAQDHLIVVADLEHLREHLPPHSEARVMLDHLENHAQVMSADQLVPIRDAAQLSSLSAEELERPAFFPADEVYKAVEWDIARAASSIELYCPFLDPRPVRKWSALLGQRVSEGVRVVIYTRAAEEQRDAAAADRHQQRIDELRGAGCEVDFRERMHEKVLILDRVVLWHGSLNLLANTGPTDLMMRFNDPASCERVSRVVERARKDREAWNPRAAAESRDADAAPVGGSQRTTADAGTRATDGIKPGDVVDGRLYLAVSFSEKDEAKRLLGARWDKPNGLWWVDAGRVTREQARRWLP
ncbi:AAA domain-containing protein [Streptomyces odonnellii]|uniref:AAA domain-containing protein n=1 Tax=Streptomyces odonnellii TaxID=1417980 RepID=UPI0018E3A4A4|nr:AAA domain-containing protein [Streptomyces odonnellii]